MASDFNNNARHSIFWPLFFWAIIVVVVAFVLPDMPMFTHVIEIEDERVIISQSDIPDVRISMGDEGSDVISLQKNLHKLGYLTYEDISGKYEYKTHSAVNAALAGYGYQESNGCTDEGFKLIEEAASKIEFNSAVSQPDEGQITTTATTASTTATTASSTEETTTTSAAETTTTTETTTTVATENKVRMARVTVKKWTKLRDIPDASGTALYNLDHGTEYEVLEETTGKDGKTWYRLKFFYSTYKWKSGWATSEHLEIFYQ